MAHRAYLCVDFFRRAAGLERIAAAAMNHRPTVFGMYLFFHNDSSFKTSKPDYNNINGQFNRIFSQTLGRPSSGLWPGLHTEPKGREESIKTKAGLAGLDRLNTIY